MNESSFDDLCNTVFQFQYQYNPIYHKWVDLIDSLPTKRKIPQNIPALPISFFKEQRVTTGNWQEQKVFESSGTTGMVTSRHYLADLAIYEQAFIQGFERQYGSIQNWCVLALLPAYLERENSSLVYMANKMIAMSNHAESGFYLYNYAELASKLTELELLGQPTLLLGVTFALLDFSAQFPLQLKHTVVMETGGMKGRGRELTRLELHKTLIGRLGLKNIHAEYGMTELLSQAYSKGMGRYYCPPWMKVFVRKEDDPFELLTEGTGLIQIVDLANIFSCSFIATQDIGKLYEDGSFEVLGRMDHADIRGCSLLVL
ncbi:acyl transferase [Sediminibacterium sp.]|uniref:LuxE/PaaK family acyltransferase n=1 Tax=Sediminibacterium sp. TaxID=1917865 RepID=UPI002736E248|nr:acyl transferase [Sediminibacterium sp.]MDP3392804.1 acyl transferase [Sediminibacterium sp.]MDP3565926.1 acyl transferase [Sediminibacterium sp.]